MKKNAMIKILSLLAVVLSMTACSNTEAPDSSSTTTTVTTTTVNTTTAPVVTPSEISSTSLSESVPVVSDETTITTTEQEVETSTSTEKIDGSTSTETTPTSTTTTKKPPTTVTTTTKATTTKKPATVTTTTTKKKTTTKTTTTKKKTTTTTTTAKKQEITTTTSPVIKITQSDVDKLVNELQEYSDSLETDAKTDLEFQEFLIKKYGSLEAWYEHRANTLTPSNSSWAFPTIVREEVTEYFTLDKAYEDVKEDIDNWYIDCPNSHIVLYAQWCPNGEGSTNTFATYDHWQIYCLR